jgi:lysylphosphatidylglycerol synthetase-like protein (DUF2156 family)
MEHNRSLTIMTKAIAFTVMGYGLAIVADTLLKQARLHPGRDIDALVISLPLLFGLSYIYLGSLLLRRKYNAWVTAVVLSMATVILRGLQLAHLLRLDPDFHGMAAWLRVLLPLGILVMLLVSHSAFQVKSDLRSFRQAAQLSVIFLLVAFLYGIGGFLLLDKRDFHQSIGLPTAIHQTIDQFGLTDDLVAAHSRRARLFLDSLPVISIGAVAYMAVSFFQPLRMRFVHTASDRARAEELLHTYPADIDDFFKLWPHDKLYYFDSTGRAGLAYHVQRGVALAVGDPFGDSKRLPALIDSFLELCSVNDWLPAFVHCSDNRRRLYEKRNLHLQKIGEEAILDIQQFVTAKKSKYFRQIDNRFTRLSYHVELLQPPHNDAVLRRLQAISHEWLERPGRSERGFLLGYHTDEYIKHCVLGVLTDETKTANYDLLRCSDKSPGNANDFLLMGVIHSLAVEGFTTLNLGLCPLAGLDEKAAEDASLITNALKFLYANGDRLYSFSGLERFKAKYDPAWEHRFIAYPGGIRNFTRVLTALNKAMKVG